MTSVLYIHGTMTRYDKDYLRAFGEIHRRIAQVDAAATVTKFPWGEYWGANMATRLRSIPGAADEADAGALSGDPSEEALSANDPVALWALLYDDPLAELAWLARAAPDASESDAGAALLERLVALESDPAVLQVAQASELDATLPEAVATMIERFDSFATDPLSRALVGMADADAPLYRPALARALVADAMRRALQAGSYPLPYFDPHLRDDLVLTIDHALGGDPGELGDVRLALSRFGAGLLRPARTGFTSFGVKFFGDILAYQGQRLGPKIRAAIADQVRAAGATVIIAHSLGGIACVELLLETDLSAHVPLLVTVGSQAPLLYEVGVLGQIPYRRGECVKLPPHFPPWLNIYDDNDYLSFVAEPFFAGQVRDFAAAGLQPFPLAHGAYWWNDRVWRAITSAMADPTNLQAIE